MDYQIPDLCVMSITEVPGKPGRVILDMPSRWDPSPQPPAEVPMSTIEFIMETPYQVPMCPPGWPNSPVG